MMKYTKTTSLLTETQRINKLTSVNRIQTMYSFNIQSKQKKTIELQNYSKSINRISVVVYARSSEERQPLSNANVSHVRCTFMSSTESNATLIPSFNILQISR